ncbi:MAG: sulfotransferase domain-containing protein [Microcoleaceae cyanobacterium]
MRLPDFLIIGAAKSGTTTLYKYLCLHPQIYMSTPKEPQFFDENYAKGVEWYSSLFTNAKQDQVCGEATTSYTHQTHLFPIPERIFSLLPKVKLIYIMRHPVDRAYSQYVQQLKLAQARQRHMKDASFKVPETFEELLKRGNSVVDANDYMQRINVLAPSMYMDRIEEYLKFFPKESFMFLLFEDFIQNPKDILHRICKFINVDDRIDLTSNDKLAANKAEDHQEWYIRSRITKPLRSIPAIGKVAALLPQELRDTAYQILQKLPYRKQVEQEYIPQKMLPDTRQMLLETFREPNQKLAEFLNRDLSHWSL